MLRHGLRTVPGSLAPSRRVRPAEGSSAPHSRRRRSIAVTVGVLALAGAGAVLVAVRARGRELPQLAGLGAIAPEVADAARQALDYLSEDPHDGSRWGRFGMTCEANGIVGAARDAYAAATSLERSNPKWWYRLAYVEARLGRSDDAIRDIGRAIELSPGYAPAHWRLGQWLLDRNETAGAERAFARAGELDPNGVPASAGLARLYLQRHEEAQAIGVLERTLVKNPGDRYALQLLGTAYRRVGRVEEAEFALAVGEGGEPAWVDPWTDEMLHFRRGFAVRLKDATAYFLAGQTAPAIALLEQLRQEKPDDIALLSHLGEVYVVAERVDEGVRMLEQVVARDPQRFEAWVNLASGHMKKDDLQRARTAIDRALAINPELGRAYETKGLIQWRAGDEGGALEAFRTAVRYDPRDVRALVFIGMVETNRARPANAIEAFARATRQDPTRVDAWLGVANAAMTLGALDRAAAALQHAAQLNPDGPAVKQASLRLQSLRR
jgi:tetratricopeptide (TPR) repeat protein